MTYQREEAAPPALCPGGAPARVQPCLPQACPPQWSNGAWSQVGPLEGSRLYCVLCVFYSVCLLLGDVSRNVNTV